MKTIRMKLFKDFLDTVVWTAWLKDSRPVSSILIALPEHCKTMLLEKYRYCDGIIYLADATARGLQEELSTRYNNNKPINHIIIPDFLNILSRQQSSVRMMLGFLNTIIYDGTASIKTHYTDFKLQSINSGLITCITTAKFLEKSKLWENIGFISRVIPISYTYSLKTKLEIAEEIKRSAMKNETLQSEHAICQFPKEKELVTFRNEQLGNQIKEIALLLPQQMLPNSKREMVAGFRLEESLFSLCKAEALKNDRYDVENGDVDKVIEYTKYMNLQFKEV